MEKEIWKDIVGYEGKYQVSNLGNVKSLNYKLSGKEKILKGSNYGNSKKSNTIYKRINLSRNSKGNHLFIHRLVAQAFIPNPEKKPQVNHKDGNGLNNYIGNLEWCTNSENQKHRFNTLGHITLFHIKNPNKGKTLGTFYGSKKVNQYGLDGNFIKTFESIKSAYLELGINQIGISLTCRGKRKTAGGFIWKYIKESN